MAGQRMIYPYTITGKMLHFPWKHYWNKGRGFRFAVIAIIVTYPLFFKLHRLMNSPGNVRLWTDNRQKRLHDHFAPPHDH